MPDFLDTSVVVRYLTADPPQQAQKAKTLIESAAHFEITETVLLETAHVLRSLYGVSREDTVDLLSAFVKRANISVHGISEARAIIALGLARTSGRTSVGDALIWAVANECAPAKVHTFDQRFPSQGILIEEPA